MNAYRSGSITTLATILLTAAALAPGCGPGGGGPDQLYTIVFELSEAPETLGELTFTIGYQGGGDFVGSGTDVDCEVDGDAGDTTGTFDDDDASEIAVELTSDDGLDESTDIVRCTLSAGDEPTAGNFPITIVDAKDAGGTDVKNEDVTVSVDAIDEVGGAAGDVEHTGQPHVEPR